MTILTNLVAILVVTNLVRVPCPCGQCRDGTAILEHVNVVGRDLKEVVSTNMLPVAVLQDIVARPVKSDKSDLQDLPAPKGKQPSDTPRSDKGKATGPLIVSGIFAILSAIALMKI